MARDKYRGRRINDLYRAIALSQEYREEIKRNLEGVEKGGISEQEYLEKIGTRIDGKTRQEWIETYNKYIEETRREIRQLEAAKPRSWTDSAIITLLAIIIVMLSISFIGVQLTGLAIFGDRVSYEDNIGLMFENSTTHTWEPANKGELYSIKLSGTIIGNGTVKVYLERKGNRYLIFDSSKKEGV
ncbi:unnamed protein product, partial [marine sediment metagenome]